MSSLVGQHIGKYRVTRQVGRGGMGTVYAAVDQTLHREVALKVLNADLDDPTVARRFKTEAIAVARLNHPGIATIYELLQHDGQWLMVMEFVRGETLEQTLRTSQAMPVERAADLTIQLLAALAHAHDQGVVHRDLKPGNVILTPGGGLKIMDFGIARIAGAEQLTSVGFTMGTPAYMAPEQVLGGDIDVRTDLYAVGIVLFQMVTGALPFEGATPVQVAQARLVGPPRRVGDVAPDLPEWLVEVLDIALAREPAARFQSATLFRDAIRRGLAGVPLDGQVSPPPVSIPVPPVPDPGVHVMEAGAPARQADIAILETQMPAPIPSELSAPVREVGPSKAQRPVRLVAAAALVALAVAAAGAWWFVRMPASPVESDVVPEPPPVVEATDPEALPSLTTPDEPVEPAPTASSPSPTGTAAARPPATGAPVGGTPAANTSPRPSGASATTGPSGRAAAPPAPDAAPIAFEGVRALVLDGRRGQERQAVLTFGAGMVRLVGDDDDGGAVFAEMPYKEITAAAYAWARDPRWHPTLAGPPIDTNMPGGIFRGSHHWLALQSRTDWMIVRMNDRDWRQITDTVTAQLGVRVDTLTAQ